MRIPLVLAFSLVITAHGFAQSQHRVQELNLKDLNGRPIRLSDYRGRVVLLNFWATWCAPCRTEIPDLIKIQKKYRNRGLRVIGITYPPQTSAEVRRFVETVKANYRVALGTKLIKGLFDDSEVLPITVIIDRNGNVQDVIRGVLYAEEFNEKIRPLIDRF